MNENKSQVPQGIKIMSWLISLFAFALGFYHTAEGLKFFKPLGFDGGAYIVSALISLLLIVAYARAVSGVKIALVFYLICAFFNFTFNINSFYPNLNSRKLLQEEAKTIYDTLTANLTLETSIGDPASLTLITSLEGAKSQCLSEIENGNGYGSKAKAQLNKFNSLAKNYGVGTIDDGSYSLKNPKVKNIIDSLMTKKIEAIQNGIALDSTKTAAYEKFKELKNIKSIADSVTKAIDLSKNSRSENLLEWNESIKSLKNIVRINDEVSRTINELHITSEKDTIIFGILNPGDNAELKYPKSEYLGHFNHTIDSVFRRIDKIDTWGVIILVFFIDFLVPLAVFMLLKNKNEESTTGNSDSFWRRIFGRKGPERF